MTGALCWPHEQGIEYERGVRTLAGFDSGNDAGDALRPVLATFCQPFDGSRELRGRPQAMLDPARAAGMVGMLAMVRQTPASLDTDLMQEKKIGSLGKAGERPEGAGSR